MMFGCTAKIDLKSLHQFETNKKKKASSSSQVISAIPPPSPLHTQTLHFIKLSYISKLSITLFSTINQTSYSTADAPTINSKPYSYIYPVVMYNRTGATLNTLKIIRYRNCNNNKIQQILNSYWEIYIIHTVYCCLFWRFGGSIKKMLSCIPPAAYLTHLQLGQIIYLCVF